MRIRYTVKNYDKTEVIFDSVRDYRVKYGADVLGNEYWVISDGTNSFRMAANYKFFTADDAEKLVLDIYEAEAKKYAVYDVDSHIRKLEINLMLL